jgi:hypothetical protein
MFDLVNVCNIKTYSVPALTTRTFEIKAPVGGAGKMRWLKIDVPAGSAKIEIKYITATTGDTTYYIVGNPPSAADYEFGFEPWEDAAESTLKGIMVDEDNYIEISLTNEGLFAAQDFYLSFFLVNATLIEI